MRNYFLILLVFALSNSVFSQSFTTRVSKTKIYTTDQLEVTFTFQGNSIDGLRNFKEPDLSRFTRLFGPNTSTSIQYINGRGSASQSFTYLLLPKQEGKISIGSASIEYNGRTFRTNPVTIEIIKGKGSSNKNNGDTQQQEVNQKDISGNVFIRTIVDKQKVYKGEQIVVTYKLYTRLPIASNMEVAKLPAYQDFWAEEMPMPIQLQGNDEVFNSKVYRTAVLKRAYLFPNKSGTLKIEPIELLIPVQVTVKRKVPSNRRDSWADHFFDDFFQETQIVNYKAVSNIERITVLPLPAEGAGKSFGGAVGQFNIQASMDNKPIHKGEPFSIKLNISGAGNIKLISVPELNLPEGITKYDPRIEEKINQGNGYSGTKTIEYILVPQVEGKRVIPPIEFTYFDPATKKYITRTTQEFNINILEGTGSGTSDVIAYDLYGIKKDLSLSRQNNLFIYSFWFWLLTAAPLGAFVYFVLKKRKDDRLNGNKTLLKFTRAEKIAREKLKLSARYLAEQNSELFFTELATAYIGYLSNKLTIDPAVFSIELVNEKAGSVDINNELLDRINKIFSELEYIRFAPKSEYAVNMSSYYSTVLNIIKEIESHFEK
jgi:hypothetical protein